MVIPAEAIISPHRGHQFTGFHVAHAIKLLFAVLLLLVSVTANAQDLTASVDRNELAINETFTLTLRYSGNQSGGQPDFNLLQQDFELLSRQQSNQYRVINGKAESFVEWTVVLAPLKEGKLFVPSLHLHGQVSDAIPMTINKAGESPAGNDRQAFLEVELDKNALYVQEQLLVKVRLYTTVGLHDIATDPLQIAGAHVEKVDEQRFERRINGVGHAVYELTYAVFPESSGELQIPALNYVAVTGRRDPFSLFNRNAQRIRLRSEAKSVQVKPKPDSYSGSHWLPAASLGMVQSWSKDPEEFKVGEPITRIITLRAEGLRAAQLPPLPALDVEGLKTYPDQPQKEDQPSTSGITGSRIETTAIVATKPGDYQLPPITITWWDSKSGRQRATQLPAFRFHISGAPLINAAQPGTVDAIPTASPTTVPVEPGFWQKIAIAAIASHLFWIIYFFYARRRLLSLEPSMISKTTAGSTDLGQLKQLVEAASPEEVQAGLRDWVKNRWPTLRTLSLESAAAELNIFELSQFVGILNDAIYKTPKKPINRQQLQILAERLMRHKDHPEEKPRELPDLFSGGTV
ncbi:BatD family protein [Microbulbifer sp. CAU 1566]|uniref:BatD family protein n=1 Tax=Microbulbifer sp. CAU 1566 TaxID=2933269 RepID=UPI002003ABBF|nr:BatD family protein [Microbulbifer sp. CAU 1566]MCK7597345.1 BatD family protein [Microbulbifer sp. CAU 1566]